MKLTNQVHLYGLDTVCFYTDEELVLHKKLSRCFRRRSKLKNDYSHYIMRNVNYSMDKINHYEHQLTRINKIIGYFKQELEQEFKNTRNKIPIRELREEFLVDRNVIDIFATSSTRVLGIKTNELTMDLMVIRVFYFQIAEDLVVNGFMYKGEKYVLFSASAGQIRTKKFVMIKESVFRAHYNTLSCGLSWETINTLGGVNRNKYLAYFSLNNSATEEWKTFDINKSIVVNDFESLVNGTVDYIDDVTYDITRKTMDILIPHTDGAGIMLEEQNKVVRLPWVKGLMAYFEFDKLILEWREVYNNPKIGIVKDIYGQEHDIIAEGIKYIFTESQFKMHKFYNSWEEYKENFTKYNCQACVCSIEEEIIPDAKINYQMLQTLSSLTEKNMQLISKKTIEDIEKIGNDYRTMMRILDVTPQNQNKNYMQQALEIYPELMRDNHNRRILKDCRASMIKDAKSGKILVDGKYTFVLPDLYAFCEKLFLGIENPEGLLQNGEVSCNLYSNDTELDCLRSPHLYREHAVRKNVINSTIQKWFKTKAIYTSTHDLITKILMFDCDGDVLLVVKNPTIVSNAKKSMKGIVPLYYIMKKAPNSPLTNEGLYEGLSHAYRSGKIGLYSNNIAKIWDSDKVGREQIDVIKWLCMESNFAVDSAKTLYMPTRPKDKDKIIKKYTKTKLPHFFIHAKNKLDYQVNEINKNPVNLLENIIPKKRLTINSTLGKMDFRLLLSDTEWVPNEPVMNKLIKRYDYWNRMKNIMIKFADKEGKNGNEIYVYNKIRKDLLSFNLENVDIVNSLIWFLYSVRKTSEKKTLWEIFGKEIVENLKKNVHDMGLICPICGKRFIPSGLNNTAYCSRECYKQSMREVKAEWIKNRRYTERIKE